jgi:hypothetical protein
MRLARWLLPALTLLVVLWLTWRSAGGARSGPGPLHSAHAAVAELALGAACEQCHRAGKGLDAAGCTRCHAAIGAQQVTRTGLHGALPGDQFERCERCHGEHHGDLVPLIAPHAFARAGVPDPARYDHGHVADFVLAGAHTTVACTACHRHADAAEPPAGGRFLGLQQRCTSCHDDVHRGGLGADCAGCHGQERPWREAPLLPHDRFPLASAHAGRECRACHAPDGPHALARTTATTPVRGCADCHDDPHGGAGAPRALQLPDATDCARCHAPTHWRAARPTPARHATLGFALAGAHATAACAACHGSANAAPRWRGTAPAAADCARCHDAPHRPELLAAATREPVAGCGGCHLDTDVDFAAGRLTAAQHAATGFALEAPHGDVACSACHRGADRIARFPGRAANACSTCHADVHAGQFAGRDHAQCTACHADSHWLPHRFGLDAHRATAFPLDGAHAAVACQRCHAAAPDAPRRFAGTTTTCADCHADVHRGRFDRRGVPASVRGRSGCARCHDTAAWTPVATFDHALWTGHALQLAHAELACAACHAPVAGAAGLGPAAGRTCADCHHDPHAGQFAAALGTDCARCHDERAFAVPRFDHGATRFPLDATHAAVPCAGCHRAQRVGTELVVRYRPLGTGCADCHHLPRRGEGAR